MKSSLLRARLAKSTRPTTPPPERGPDTGRTVFYGLALIAVFFGGFGGWAALAPLQGAAVAQGVVIVNSKRKLIQHLEGGIVREVLVRDGDTVKAGQILVRLEDTTAAASAQMSASRYNTATALAARLLAEQAGEDGLDFPAELMAQQGDSAVARLMAAQQSIFKSKYEVFLTQTNILNQKISQTEEEIRGLEGQVKAQRTQLELIEEEIRDTAGLLTKGLAQKPRVLQLRRTQAEIEGQIHQNVSSIARARQQIGESRLRLAELKAGRVNEAAKEHSDALKEMSEFQEKLRAARDVVSRTDVRAPIGGIVVNLSLNTIGGVIAPGGHILDIVPTSDRLVVEGKLEVKDINKVRPGLPAEARLLAFNQRTTPPVEGVVTWIAADRTDDDKSRTSYYSVLVEIDEAKLAAMDKIKLHPGMPVELMIVTESRSALDYLFAPIHEAFTRGMREQ